MKPTRSANRTDTTRRSMAGAEVAEAAAGSRAIAPGLAVVSGLPHSPQNLLSGAFGEEQEPQITTSAVPHSLQNLRPASLSAPHAEQIISAPAACQAEGYPAGPTRVGRTHALAAGGADTTKGARNAGGRVRRAPFCFGPTRAQNRRWRTW